MDYDFLSNFEVWFLQSNFLSDFLEINFENQKSWNRVFDINFGTYLAMDIYLTYKDYTDQKLKRKAREEIVDKLNVSDK